jgi:hypothetical protein
MIETSGSSLARPLLRHQPRAWQALEPVDGAGALERALTGIPRDPVHNIN